MRAPIIEAEKGGTAMMKRFKARQTVRLFIFLLSGFVIAGCGDGGNTGHWLPGNVSVQAITAFSLNGVSGAINETAKTISVTMPNGTPVTALVATFTTTGTAVRVGTAVQTSGITPNNFTNPVVYTVTAADNTTAAYTVTVTLALNSAKAITAYSLAGVAGTINETAKTISVTMPNGTPVTALVATFTTTGTGVTVGTTAQTSGTTPNNFTSPVVYTVTAADSTTAAYTVTVTVAPITAKAITAYSFVGFTGFAGIINEPAKTIAVNLPSGTPVTALVATFTITGTGVTVLSAVQTSGTTPNDFTSPVVYTVTAGDNTTAAYTVTVTLAPSAAKAITAYSLNGVAGTINETAKTISVTMPNGTPVTALVATFTTTGTGVTVATAVQTSGTTPNDFTSPVAYRVTAADNTFVDYLVTVTVAAAVAANPAPVNLGTAGDLAAAGGYAILAKTGVSTVPSSVVTGNVGLSPAARVGLTGWSLINEPTDTSFTSAQVLAPGRLFAADQVGGTTSADLGTAVLSMEAAYTDAASRTASSAATTNVGGGTLTGLTLTRGVYEWGSAVTIPTNLTLSGSATDVWIFKVAGTLNMAAAQNVILSGGALPQNIFWQVSGVVTIGANTHFEGIILGQTAITFGNLASINGRLLAQTAVTLDATTVTQP
jgi:ice-binding like protein